MWETPGAFTKRGQALENEFFHRVDAKLLAELREKIARERSRSELSSATGFRDATLVDALLDSGFQSTTLVALAIVPCIFVAWADGSVSEAEREAVVHAAHERGIGENSLGNQMLFDWLECRPEDSLWIVWRQYAHALAESLSPALRESLRAALIRQATDVATASGGVLGIGTISPAQQSVIDEVAALVPSQSV